jgi:transcription elongation factor GreA
MQVPIRKPGKYTFDKPDVSLTEAKFNELKKELERLKKNRPGLAAEVRRCAEMGDLSENAGYQIAKGRLRSLNQKIIDLENHLGKAVIIKPSGNSLTIQLGHKVTVEAAGRQMAFVILGSAEADPGAGIISHNSPIGLALIGRRAGETVKVKLKDREIEYKIVSFK